jgi:hypothetical protein
VSKHYNILLATCLLLSPFDPEYEGNMFPKNLDSPEMKHLTIQKAVIVSPTTVRTLNLTLTEDVHLRGAEENVWV